MKNIITIFMISIPLFLIGQDNISIKDAINLGLKNNYDILITKKDKDINRVNNTWGNAGALPQININSEIGKNISDQSNNPTSFIQEILKSNSLNLNANINWTLFNGFAIKANKERLNQIEQLSEGNLRIVIENTLQAIILSYYNCVVQQNRSILLEKVVKLSKERVISERSKNEIGIASKMDYLQAKSSLLIDSSNLVIQRLNLSSSIKNFNLLIGTDIDKKWRFDSTIQHSFQLYNYETLLEKSLSNNANIYNQYINIELSNQDMKLSKSIFYPMISFNAGSAYNQNHYDLGENIEYTGSTTGKSLSHYVNLSLNFRIFDGGKLYSTIKNIKNKQEKDILELEKMKKTISMELSKTLETYNKQIVIYNINSSAYDIAKTNYNLAMQQYKRGLINSFIFRDIEISYISSGISFMQSSFNLKESEIYLSKIIGGIIQENEN